MNYRGQTKYDHQNQGRVGILLSNLGTPEAPTAKALRTYLREFLSDPRVIELPRWKWLPILYLFVLTFRPRKSAALYQKIWTQNGSPLLQTSLQQRDLLQQALQANFGSDLVVSLGMRYGNPSIESALEELRAQNVQRLLVFPLYPQYSASTTASTFDAVAEVLTKWRWLPELRMVMRYHDEPAYIAALAESVRELWDQDGEPQKLLMSFHGIPRRYFDNGDPYYCYCQKTGRLLQEKLSFPKERALVTFQSLFGREEWLKPYTIDTLTAWGSEKLSSVDVICPGFTADCLETLEEIDQLNREAFTHAGGGRFRYIPALNNRPPFITALKEIAVKNLQGWIAPGSAAGSTNIL